jgi:hypothetical protein
MFGCEILREARRDAVKRLQIPMPASASADHWRRWNEQLVVTIDELLGEFCIGQHNHAAVARAAALDCSINDTDF